MVEITSSYVKMRTAPPESEVEAELMVQDAEIARDDFIL